MRIIVPKHSRCAAVLCGGVKGKREWKKSLEWNVASEDFFLSILSIHLNSESSFGTQKLFSLFHAVAEKSFPINYKHN